MPIKILLLGLLIAQAMVPRGLADSPASIKSSLRAHVWADINFPSPAGRTAPYFCVRPDEKNKGMALYIEFTSSKAEKDHLVFAQLYRENGETVESVGGNLANPDPTPRTVNPTMPGQQEPDNTSWSAEAVFPWGKNNLDAAWIGVSMGSEKYWLELPYGFDRNPKEALPSAQAGAAPQMPSAMKALTNHDHVLSWESVGYDLGKIQNGWDLSLTQSNPGDGKCELCLVSQNSRKNIDLFSPRTAVQAFNSDGDAVGTTCRGIRFDDDGFRRDSFDLYRYPCDEKIRCWGQIEVKVDKRPYQAVIPSSLYKFEHGHTPTN